MELLRRIERGVLSGTLLARQTGLKPAHISNFLHRKRRLSLGALDRVLSTQSIAIEDLIARSPNRRPESQKQDAQSANNIALVSQSVAMYESQLRMSSVLELIHIPSGYLEHLRARRSPDRRTWERFVAVRANYLQAEVMIPAIVPHAILVIDRHYNSLVPYRPPMPSIYAMRRGSTLLFRYATLQGRSIILRTHKFEHPVELIEIKPEESPNSFIIGRICVCISEV